ncbi:hypothetical protein P0F40_001145 [Vibrio metschnikovii]|uniref:Uncharacterized protein n=2 Tax=Unclassified Bacteria TaxID=49928 RepID=A0AAU6UXK4_UNCXX|nr:hypothetical protein [Vibrio metschnikovii]EKO3576184.1 hypothetical protein [Vibrio metschnikovii]EKO3591047.1 hypothetical protein [Vibrio metschnikovii]EKO3640776.1 hypothetical protein [Vibrio metschnikovii]EKO3664997.1 hypothetical protein [Vibrio metschnikovii]EKO3698036.1 hypothetical protein [Vibrio metschnikovii]
MGKWLLWFGLFSLPAQAVHEDFLLPFLNPNHALPSLSEWQESHQWLECAEESDQLRWCSDEFYYYSTLVWASIHFMNEQPVMLVLHLTYSAHDWSQLQLALRRDGFQVDRVQIAEAIFSVDDQRNDKTSSDVDRQLILFLNHHAHRFPKRQQWSMSGRHVELLTDGKDIEVRWLTVIDND